MSKPRAAKLGLLICTMLWGSSFAVAKFATAVMPPCYLLALRMTIGSAVLLLLSARKLRFTRKTTLIRGAVNGFLLYAASVTQTIGLTQTTPGKNAFLVASYCVLTPFAAWLIERRRPDRYNVAAGLVCVVGIALVSLTETLSVAWGDAIALVSGVLFAVQIVVVGLYSRREDPLLLTLCSFVACGLLGWLCGGLFEVFPAVIPTETVLSVVYLSVFCSAVALLLQNVGQKYTDPSPAAIIMSMESVFAVLLSVLFFGEQPNARTIAGFCTILAAVLLSELKPPIPGLSRRRLTKAAPLK